MKSISWHKVAFDVFGKSKTWKLRNVDLRLSKDIIIQSIVISAWRKNGWKTFSNQVHTGLLIVWDDYPSYSIAIVCSSQVWQKKVCIMTPEVGGPQQPLITIQ